MTSAACLPSSLLVPLARLSSRASHPQTPSRSRGLEKYCYISRDSNSCPVHGHAEGREARGNRGRIADSTAIPRPWRPPAPFRACLSHSLPTTTFQLLLSFFFPVQRS
ncbi:hypothetical protein VTH06DRAFT_2087 [Thermothelomyces fergusii]